MIFQSASIGAVALAAFALAWAAISDVRAYEIPNATALVIAVAYVAFAIVNPHAPRLGALATSVSVLCAGLVLFARGWMGGGDVKLMSAVTFWCGPSLLPQFAIVTGFAGAALAALMLTPLRRLMPPAPAAAVAAVDGGSALAQPMPFGVAIALGGAWILADRVSGLR